MTTPDRADREVRADEVRGIHRPRSRRSTPTSARSLPGSRAGAGTLCSRMRRTRLPAG
ncbi:MAG: hypothetical protein MZU79_09340 [Anaerotruncus sp.]|nr:hypothetical protein [Anaerotruncus sp.]